MSYDINLVMPRPGESIEEAATRDVLDDGIESGEELVPGLSEEHVRARNARVIAALTDIHPEFHLFETETHVELTDVARGIQINLYDDSGNIAIPYWRKNQASPTLLLVERCLKAIAETTDFRFYNPQTGEVLTAQSGYRIEPNTMSWGMNVAEQIGKKPWWKFW